MLNQGIFEACNVFLQDGRKPVEQEDSRCDY